MAALGIWTYGICQDFGTGPDTCDADMWHGAYYYLMYTFFSLPLAVALVCCFGCFAAGKAAGAAAEVEKRRMARPHEMV